MFKMLRYSVLVTLTLSGCVSLPTGPSVMVLPGTGKNFDQFRYDDQYCRRYSVSQLGGSVPQQAYLNSGLGSAVAGAGLGAGVGAAIGGGTGAAIGAGTGLAAGSMSGATAANVSGYEAQEYYDMNYIQCMYALGHRVPVSGQFSNETKSGVTVNQNPNLPPPPPAGQPPAPPPR